MIDMDADRLYRENQLELSSLTVKLWDIEIISGGRGYRLAQQLTIPNAFVVLLNGDAILQRESGVCHMHKDRIYICPPESTFGISGGEKEEIKLAIIRFGLFRDSERSYKRLKAVNAEGFLTKREDTAIATSGKLAALCLSMHERSSSLDPLVKWRAQMDCQELIYEIMAAEREQPMEDKHIAIERSKAYLEEHFCEALTIERLAGIAEISPKYYGDMFKKRYGFSALDHLATTRLNKAKRLMLSSNRLLREVAHEVGYEDEFYFSRKFKKQFGVSPSEFMKKRKRKVALYGSTSLMGYLTVLDFIPYAAPLHPKWSGYYYEQYASDIAVHLNAYRQNLHKQANLDKLAQTSPELIICDSGLETWEKEQLSAIAPLYELPEGTEGWSKRLLMVADLLGEREEAERWMAAFERKLAVARESVQRDSSVLTVRLLKNRFFVHCNDGIRDVIYDGLGIGSPYSEERLPLERLIEPEEFDTSGADRILLVICQETETLEGWKQLQQSPQWLSLKVVRENRLHLIASEPWREYSPRSLECMLEEAKLIFSGKCP